MIFRSLFLYLSGIKGFFRKVRYDLGREAVVGLAGLVLSALFYYVASDFINEEVASLSQGMRDSFARFLALVLLALATLLTARQWRAEAFGSGSLGAFARVLGEQPGGPILVLSMRLATIAALWFGVAWGIIHTVSLVDLSAPQLLVLQAIGLTVAALPLLRQPSGMGNVARTIRASTIRSGGSSAFALINWRFELTVRRLTDARLCLAAAGVAMIGLTYLGFRQAPMPAMVAVAFTVGELVAGGLTLALAADLSAAWIERTAGVSHEQFADAWKWVAWGLAGGIGLLTTALTLAPHLLFADVTWSHIAGSLKLGALAALMPALFPSLMLQIDGRRPLAQMMAQILVGMFVGTAIYAHWAGLILVPVVHSYGAGLQHGRFYRS